MKYQKYLNWIQGIALVLWIIGWILRDIFDFSFGKWIVDIAFTVVLICVGFDLYMQYKLKKREKSQKSI